MTYVEKVLRSIVNFLKLVSDEFARYQFQTLPVATQLNPESFDFLIRRNVRQGSEIQNMLTKFEKNWKF